MTKTKATFVATIAVLFTLAGAVGAAQAGHDDHGHGHGHDHGHGHGHGHGHEHGH